MDASTKAAAAINTATKAAADAWSDVTIGGKDADTLMMAARLLMLWSLSHGPATRIGVCALVLMCLACQICLPWKQA